MKRENIAILTLIGLFLFIFYQFHLLHISDVMVKESATELQTVNSENTALHNEIDKLKTTVTSQNKQLDIFLDEKNSPEKIAYLTFDDGPSLNTPIILDILKEHDIPATFFVNGYENEFASSIYNRIVHENHTLANHTFSHNYSVIYRNKESFFTDFYQLENLLMNYTDKKSSIVRLPGGSNNTMVQQYGGTKEMNKILAELKNQGYYYVDWNVDSMDASDTVVTKNRIVSEVLNQSLGKQKVNILMHDSSAKTTTAEALPAIIKGLKEQGFRFEKISERSPIIQFK